MSYTSVEENSRPELGKPKKHKYSRFSTRCFCTGFVIVVIFLAVISLMIVLPLVQRIKETVNSHNGQKNKTPSDPKDKVDPVTPKNNIRLIDPDTPKNKRSITSWKDKEEWVLQFSDEFNKDARSFRPGDDPAWEAVDLWYESTGDEEYYSPSHVTTQDGKLVITIEEKAVGELKYTSGMLQSWNKVCFTGGRIEVSVSLPGNPTDPGFWPGAWLLGNLARAGYKSTTDGVWPYSYDECDTAVLPNQGLNSDLSRMPGQKLNKCVCPGADHPSPGKGRGAPEIDLIEARSNPHGGEVSQSLQIAPFDADLVIKESKAPIYANNTVINEYRGGKLQQCVSTLSPLPKEIYGNKKFISFAVEYEPGPNGYITWFMDDKQIWTVTSEAIGPNSKSKVGQRLIPEEPMYMILNLAISAQFSKISTLKFPDYFLIDYVRLYQHPKRKSVTCDPKDYPTAKYIEDHWNAYYIRNWTTWKIAGYEFPEYKVGKKC